MTILLLAFKGKLPNLYPSTSTGKELYDSVCSTFQRKTEDSWLRKIVCFLSGHMVRKWWKNWREFIFKGTCAFNKDSHKHCTSGIHHQRLVIHFPFCKLSYFWNLDTYQDSWWWDRILDYVLLFIQKTIQLVKLKTQGNVICFFLIGKKIEACEVLIFRTHNMKGGDWIPHQLPTDLHPVQTHAHN